MFEIYKKFGKSFLSSIVTKNDIILSKIASNNIIIFLHILCSWCVSTKTLQVVSLVEAQMQLRV